MRKPLVSLLVLAALVSGPAIALASGPSAGDNQYTDPLNGTTTATHTSSAPSSSPASSSSSPASASSAPTGTSASSTPSQASTQPAATTANTKTLPYTGLNVWLGAAVGIGLVGIGLGVRFAVRRA